MNKNNFYSVFCNLLQVFLIGAGVEALALINYLIFARFSAQKFDKEAYQKENSLKSDIKS